VNHVVVGAALPLAICAVIYAARGFRASSRLLVLGPLVMLISGVIAVIPDLPRLWGDQVKYVDWHHRSWCNLSWGHCWIDKHDAIENWPGWTVIAIVVGALVLGVAWRELRTLEASWRT
jgi:hypothetical protein